MNHDKNINKDSNSLHASIDSFGNKPPNVLSPLCSHLFNPNKSKMQPLPLPSPGHPGHTNFTFSPGDRLATLHMAALANGVCAPRKWDLRPSCLHQPFEGVWTPELLNSWTLEVVVFPEVMDS